MKDVLDRIGVISPLKEDCSNFKKVTEFGLKVCQLVSWDPSKWTEETAENVKQAVRETGIRVTCLWAGWPGPKVWNFVDGPVTLGLVPAGYRSMRLEAMLKAGEFALRCGLKAVTTHLGFIPENPRDNVFGEVVNCVRFIAEEYRKKGLEFWFETGQETPVTLLRLIKEAGTDNLGINLDPANLILYGKANPIDALDVFGEYVRNIHAKDGFYPTDPWMLGKEARIGDGKVNYPLFVKRLQEIGFQGEFIIEREISGPKQEEDIRYAVEYLSGLLKED